MRSRTQTLAALVIGFAVSACAELPPLGVCGNGVVERNLGESCDGPDGCAACHLVCEPGEVSGCPVGAGCGADGVCRYPAGAMSPPVIGPRLDAITARLSDVDGDHRADVVSVGRELSVVSGNGAVDLSAVSRALLPADAAPTSAVIARLDGDARVDAVVPLRERLAVYRGAAEGLLMRLNPGILDDVEVLGAAPVISPAGRPWIAGLTREDGGPIRLVLSVNAEILGEASPCGVTDATSWVGPVRAPGPPGGDSVIVVAGDQVCAYEPELGPTPLGGPLAIAVGRPVNRMLAVELDDTPAGSDPCAELVFEGTDGSFWLSDASYVGRCTYADAVPIALLTWPAGVGDLTGNGDQELITSCGITRIIPPTAVACLAPVPRPLSTGVIADLNRDGIGDVIGAAGATGERDLVVMLGIDTQGLPSFSTRIIPTLGPVLGLVSTDLDRDLFPDVVMFERDDDPGSPAEAYRMSVLYGGPQAATATPLAELGGWTGASAGALFGIDQTGQDPYGDLVITSEAGVALVYGSGNRALTAPYVLRPLSPQSPLVAGADLEGDGRANDVIATAVSLGDPAVNLWGFAGGDGELRAPGVVGLALPADVSPVAIAVGALDGPIVIVAAMPVGADLPVPPMVLLTPWTPLAPAPFTDAGVQLAGDIEAIDAFELDGDPAGEVVIATNDGGVRHLYRGDLIGTAAAPGLAIVELTDPAGVATRPFQCSRASPIELGELGPDGVANVVRDELVAACEVTEADGVRALLMAFHTRADRLVGPFAIGSLPAHDGTALAAGDFTGDGIDDVAFLAGSALNNRLLLAVQCAVDDPVGCFADELESETR